MARRRGTGDLQLAAEPQGLGARLLRLTLAQKLALAFIGLVTFVLLVNGALSMWLSFGEARRAAVQVQQEKAQAAAERVEQFITEIESQLGWTTRAEWARVGLEQRRYDFIRLLRQVPAITELAFIDGSGHEQLKLSRLEPDVVGSNADLSAEPRFRDAVDKHVWYGPVTFRRGSEPYMSISIAHAGRNPGVTAAEVNLKLIWDVLTALRVGEGGFAYVTDAQGRLVAHPDMSLVLRDSNMTRLPQVTAALAGGPAPERAIGLDGQSMLSAHAVVPRLGWIVFVELPTREALAPVYAALVQTAALLGLGLLVAAVTGSLVARRLVGPIRVLQAGAERLGQGDLSQRITVRTGDEIETLADRFNQMAGRIQESYETLEAKVEARTQDLNESLRQQTETADVLKVISRSAFDLQSVLDTLISSAVRLCNANSGNVLLRDGEVFRARAQYGGDPTLLAFLQANPMRAGTETVAGRVAMTGAMENIVDVTADPDYNFPGVREHGGMLAVLGVPLLRDGQVEGVLVLNRPERVAFTPRQIELATTFADQAVIAVENARLFEEVQARTRELARSLEELRTAKDRLVQTEKLASLGQLTAGIAHEIKNPLNFVNNFSVLSAELIDELGAALEPAPLDAATRAEVEEVMGMLKGNLEKVVHHGKRADGIVKNMLLHSREGGGDRRRVDVNATVDEALNLAYHGARAEKPGFNITLERHFDPAAGALELYPQEFTRVMLNLISNGFYAATSKKANGAAADFEPTLAVSTQARADSVVIRVRDNGTGIPDSVKAQMFNPFFTTKPAGEGTGLGLSLSHDIIVKQHNGEISVDSAVGAFTEFTVTLPRAAPGATS